MFHVNLLFIVGECSMNKSLCLPAPVKSHHNKSLLYQTNCIS